MRNSNINKADAFWILIEGPVGLSVNLAVVLFNKSGLLYPICSRSN